MKRLLRVFLVYVLFLFSHSVFAQIDPQPSQCGWFIVGDGRMGPCVNDYSGRIAKTEYVLHSNGINEMTTVYVCPVGYSIYNDFCYLSCPSGTEKVGNQCLPLCSLGFDRNESGQCVKDCTGKQGQPTTNGSYSFIGAVSTWSVSGCRVKCPVRVLAAGGGNGHACYYQGLCTRTA